MDSGLVFVIFVFGNVYVGCLLFEFLFGVYWLVVNCGVFLKLNFVWCKVSCLIVVYFIVLIDDMFFCNFFLEKLFGYILGVLVLFGLWYVDVYWEDDVVGSWVIMVYDGYLFDF